MHNGFSNFFYMNGHGWYIWSAYGSVIIVLAVQWFIPWRAWRSFMKLYYGNTNNYSALKNRSYLDPANE